MSIEVAWEQQHLESTLSNNETVSTHSGLGTAHLHHVLRKHTSTQSGEEKQTVTVMWAYVIMGCTGWMCSNGKDDTIVLTKHQSPQPCSQLCTLLLRHSMAFA